MIYHYCYQQQENTNPSFKEKLNLFNTQSLFYFVNMDSLNRTPDLILNRISSKFKLCDEKDSIDIEIMIRNVGNWKAPSYR